MKICFWVVLVTDMSAFKAANPGAIFADFVRWHSPKDWLPAPSSHMWGGDDEDGAGEGGWPPEGELSERMRSEGNLWAQLWQNAPVLAAEDQKPLMDIEKEAEKVIHYLVTINPADLLTQMLCTAYTSGDDVLARCEWARLAPVVAERREFGRRCESMLDATGERWIRKGGGADTSTFPKMRIKSCFESASDAGSGVFM